MLFFLSHSAINSLLQNNTLLTSLTSLQQNPTNMHGPLGAPPAPDNVVQ